MQRGIWKARTLVWTEFLLSPDYSSPRMDQRSASSIWRSDIRPVYIRECRYVEGKLNQAIAIASVDSRQQALGVRCDVKSISRQYRTLFPLTDAQADEVIATECAEAPGVQHSTMDDASLKEFAALTVCEPYALKVDRRAMISPMGHDGPTTHEKLDLRKW